MFHDGCNGIAEAHLPDEGYCGSASLSALLQGGTILAQDDNGHPSLREASLEMDMNTSIAYFGASSARSLKLKNLRFKIATIINCQTIAI